MLRQDFGTDYFHLGLIGNLCFLAFGLGSLPSGILSALAYALFYFSTQPTLAKLVAQYTSVRFRGLAYGINFFVGFGIGSFASNLSGYVADLFGL